MKAVMFAINILFLTGINKAQDYQFKLLYGPEIKDEINFIAQQRIDIFKEYPYLYEGNFETEIAYLMWFVEQRDSCAAIAYKDNNPVGFITGISFVAFENHFKGSKDIFIKASLDPSAYYYFCEVIVKPEHRRNSIAKRLFALLEAHAKSQGYRAGCFVNESHEDHPLKPADYKDLTSLFHALGYTKTNLSIMFKWQTLAQNGKIEELEHILTYWLKDF